MTLFDAIVLGIIQGLTEFLPVSSSGHLVLGQSLLGVDDPGVTFEIFVHLGSLLAVLIYFRSKLLSLILSLFKSIDKDNRKVEGLVFCLLHTMNYEVLLRVSVRVPLV